MFILVLVVLMISPEGERYNQRTEYLFSKAGDCEKMVETLQTLTKGHPVHYRYRCEQVS